MAYIITQLCIRAGDCVEVCPVECIVPVRPAIQIGHSSTLTRIPVLTAARA